MKAPPTPREQFERIVTLFRRSAAFWKRGLAVFAVGVLVSVPFVLRLPRTYRSDMVILYQETIRSSDVTGGDGYSEGARRAGARLRELLLSRASLEPIINDLHLYPGSIIHGELIGAVEEMRKNIQFHAREGDTYEISFTAGTPLEAQQVTQRLGDCIIRESETRRTEQAKTLKEFLTTESQRNETELKQKEAELTRFVVMHPEFSARLQGVPSGTGTTSGGSSIGGAFDPLLASLDARAARIARQLDAKSQPSVAAPAASSTFQPPPDSPELIAARRDLADKQSRFTDKHPDVIAARARLAAAEQAQAAANEAAAAAYAQQSQDAPAPKNATDEAALRKQLAILQAQAAARRLALSAPAAAAVDAGVLAESPVGTGPVEFELEFRRLQREINDGRDRQQQLEERLFRASITASSVMDDRNIEVSVLDPAYLPVRAISKPRSIILAGLLALSLVLALATAVLSASLDDRIYDRMDVERIDILPLIAVIPREPARNVRRLGPGPTKRTPR